MRISAREWLGQLLDEGSFTGWDRTPVEVDASPRYREELRAAAVAAGTDEAVITGAGALRGRPVAVIACEFGFLAGSIGVAAAERVVETVERATALGLPLIASPTSGGTRMQEGTVAFAQMVKIAGALATHKSAGHPYLVYLRDPTMGGVFASWGSLGHMTFAQPGALIGFLGPRVYKALYDKDFPEGVQTAENLYRHGVIDGVVPVRVFRLIAHRALSVLSGEPSPPSAGRSRPGDSSGAARSSDELPDSGSRVRRQSGSDSAGGAGAPPSGVPGVEPSGPHAAGGAEVSEQGGSRAGRHSGPDSAEGADMWPDSDSRAGGGSGRDVVRDADVSAEPVSARVERRGSELPVPAGATHVDVPAWRSVLISRRPDRPGLRELLRHVTQRVPLSGTGQGEADRSVVHALARFRGQPCVVFGHDRSGGAGETMGPAALREARRSMALAEELRVPLVLVIDTVGAALSKEAEERGLAPEIARCIADLVTLDTPTVSVLLGQGTGGGALALLPADRVLAATHGWLAPLPPEGASAIVYRDTDHAPELAAAQRIRSLDLLADGIVDRIVPEYPDAADEPIDFARRMVAAIAEELTHLRTLPQADLARTRHTRYRRLGTS
ncbi:acetyl-CoA carboxyl transferase [Nocardia puris]|uniref:acetyl-coenzyme A carboxylase carboxyl transferase subunits beta/alpha n=1 Tax=Nocardia puris TaxID=208602 RepID=UPI001892E8ED|nr:carboxyl transferase domain-containing protein [Nocardia puris]MBF6211691.1 acetyl-CoA carboxyl transferase [Nocardia puris]MBF6365695.1 acetyl-CoA carboxyl transferase [Nocardia puris]MBF6460663.1 acetyl-CoA carboxyl transferase [Nocardia puris]